MSDTNPSVIRGIQRDKIIILGLKVEWVFWKVCLSCNRALWTNWDIYESFHDSGDIQASM